MQRSRAATSRVRWNVERLSESVGERFQQAIIAGQREQAHELLARAAGRLRGYLTQRFGVELGGEQGVETVISTALWKALEHGLRFQPDRSSLSFWIFRIGVNEAQDELRRVAIRRRHERAAAHLDSGRDEQAQRELRERILAAIDGLGDQRHRAILHADLKCGGLAPSVDLAKEHGLAQQTILNLRSEARRLIRQRLEGLLNDDA